DGGDQDAFAQLYAAYVRMVHAIVLGRVPRKDVDDLVQDVFLTAYTRLGELRDPAAFGGWIATIARNRATDHLRQSREEPGLPDADEQRLEQLLGRLKTTRPAPQLPVRPPALRSAEGKPDATYETHPYDDTTARVRWRTVRFLAPALAATAAIIVMVALAWKTA